MRKKYEESLQSFFEEGKKTFWQMNGVKVVHFHNIFLNIFRKISQFYFYFLFLLLGDWMEVMSNILRGGKDYLRVNQFQFTRVCCPGRNLHLRPLCVSFIAPKHSFRTPFIILSFLVVPVRLRFTSARANTTIKTST